MCQGGTKGKEILFLIIFFFSTEKKEKEKNKEEEEKKGRLMHRFLLDANSQIEKIVAQLCGPDAISQRKGQGFSKRTLILFMLVAQQANTAISGILLLCSYEEDASKAAGKATILFPFFQSLIEEFIFRALLVNEPIPSSGSIMLASLHFVAIIGITITGYFVAPEQLWLVNYLVFSLIQALVLMAWAQMVVERGSL